MPTASPKMAGMKGFEPLQAGFGNPLTQPTLTPKVVGPGGIEPPSFRIFSPALLPSKLQPQKMVHSAGFEPALPEGNEALNLARLPSSAMSAKMVIGAGFEPARGTSPTWS
jgi:hypothetical protein